MLQVFWFGCYIYFTNMLQQYAPIVSSISILCCSKCFHIASYKCFIWMLNTFHTYVARVSCCSENQGAREVIVAWHKHREWGAVSRGPTDVARGALEAGGRGTTRRGVRAWRGELVDGGRVRRHLYTRIRSDVRTLALLIDLTWQSMSSANMVRGHAWSCTWGLSGHHYYGSSPSHLTFPEKQICNDGVYIMNCK
jgi:hypothetical protein